MKKILSFVCFSVIFAGLIVPIVFVGVMMMSEAFAKGVLAGALSFGLMAFMIVKYGDFEEE